MSSSNVSHNREKGSLSVMFSGSQRGNLLFNPICILLFSTFLIGVLVSNETRCNRAAILLGIGKGSNTISNMDNPKSSMLRIPEDNKTIVFLGIFSTQKLAHERSYIRDTMLYGSDLPLHVHDRLCTYYDFVNASIPTDNCQIVYGFVMGQHKDSSRPHMYQPASDQHILLSESKPRSDNATPSNNNHGNKWSNYSDLIQLNIHENMNDGKTPSFFYFCRQQLGHLVHYCIKADSDTYIPIPKFLDFINHELPKLPLQDPAVIHYNESLPTSYIAPPPTNTKGVAVYAGFMNEFAKCGGLLSPHCRDLLGSYYMAGAFVLVSASLTPYIDAPARHRLSKKHNAIKGIRKYEDFSTGYMLTHTYTKSPIHTIFLNNALFFRHGWLLEGFKDETRYRQAHQIAVANNFTWPENNEPMWPLPPKERNSFIDTVLKQK